MDMDRIAKSAILDALETHSFITPNFPIETFRSHTGFGKISGSPIEAIYDWHGYRTAKKLFDWRGIVSVIHFDLIFWDGMKKAISKFPDKFRSWIAKQSHTSAALIDNSHEWIHRYGMFVQVAVDLTKVPPISLGVLILDELLA
jgi:hypothetical protein